MKRSEFDSAMGEVKAMFSFKQNFSEHFLNAFYKYAQAMDKTFFLEAASELAINGDKFTLENLLEALVKVRQNKSGERVKSDCAKCGGEGAIVANGFAYSCNCIAGINYPNYPKYEGQVTKDLVVTEEEDCHVRKFGRYTVTVPKGARSVKNITFRID